MNERKEWGGGQTLKQGLGSQSHTTQANVSTHGTSRLCGVPQKPTSTCNQHTTSQIQSRLQALRGVGPTFSLHLSHLQMEAFNIQKQNHTHTRLRKPPEISDATKDGHRVDRFHNT